MSSTIDTVNKTLAKRYAREKRFKFYGLLSVMTGLAALLFLLSTILSNGWGAFTQSYVRLSLDLDPEVLGIDDPTDDQQWQYASHSLVIKAAMRERFPEMRTRSEKKRIYRLVSPNMKRNPAYNFPART